MIDRTHLRNFLNSHGFEAQANDQASLVFAERLIEVLAEPTEGMEAAYHVVIYQQMVRARELNDGTEIYPLPGAVWKAMWSARFRGE